MDGFQFLMEGRKEKGEVVVVGVDEPAAHHV